MKKVGLYLHIPFCANKCKYCSFNSYANLDFLHTDYLLALIKEIEIKESKKDFEIDTIFIGGGTPSILENGYISRIFEAIYKNFKVREDAEITIEANPNSITLEKAKEWKNAGINRVSVGLQSSSEKVLKAIGRVHTKKDYINAMRILKDVGFNSLNTDLMLGLPYQEKDDIKNSIMLAKSLGATHISYYSLILEEGTPLFNLVENNEIELPSEDKTIKLYDFALKTLEENGYHRYEVSNFALKGFECRHNVNCWEMHEYLGIGAGANGYLNGIRYGNIANVQKYIENVVGGKNFLEFEEKEENGELLEEAIMLGLRQTKGISISNLKENYNFDILIEKSKEIENLRSLGLILIKDDYLKASEKGFYVLNKIILDLVP